MMNKTRARLKLFFCMKSTTWKCKYILSHYSIGLHDSSIQTDMFWAKTKWTYVQRRNNVTFSTGRPRHIFVSEESPTSAV